MTTDSMTANDSKKTDTSKEQPQGTAAADNVPSGFILKLYQMVNGAPDEVIRVSVRFFDDNRGLPFE